MSRQPKSFNNWKKESDQGEKYARNLRAHFFRANKKATMLSGNLYGIVYYFYKKDTLTDADNISKPIWDCMEGFFYENDRQVKLRIAGCFDLSTDYFQSLDVTNIPGDLIYDLIESITENDHTIYIECGALENNFYKFNLESDGN